MKILFILDPIEKLSWHWDNSLYLAREFLKRGHHVGSADIPDLLFENRTPKAFVRPLAASSLPYKGQKIQDRYGFKKTKANLEDLTKFDLVLIRKEPPFDSHYLAMTHLLDLLPKRIRVVNSPSGLRTMNEKLCILKYPDLIPRTCVSNSAAQIIHFQKKIQSDIVVKPLDQKGGKGVILIPFKHKAAESIVRKSSGSGKRFLMAQERLLHSEKLPEKRIILLEGRVLSLYGKRPIKNEFRANLDLGSAFFPAELDRHDKTIISRLKPELKAQGIHFAGLDILGGKLLEVNVTCPAGISEAKHLYPKLALVEAWANSLEALCS